MTARPLAEIRTNQTKANASLSETKEEISTTQAKPDVNLMEMKK